MVWKIGSIAVCLAAALWANAAAQPVAVAPPVGGSVDEVVELGEIEADAASPWIPLIHVDWQDEAMRNLAAFRPGWNEEGLRLSMRMPLLDADERMPVGRLPDAPFSLDMRFAGGEGPYHLYCVSLTEPFDSMMTRHQAYLMNFRPGANADVGESGHVMCQERTARGILPEDVRTRWSAVENGVALEALIPWETLRLDPGTDVVFELDLHQAGMPAVRWSGRVAPAPLKKAGEPIALEPFVEGTLVSGTFQVVFPPPVDEFRIADRKSTTPNAEGFATLHVADLADGTYELQVLVEGEIAATRDIHIANVGVAAVGLGRKHLKQRLTAMRVSHPALNGHLARAELAVELAHLPATAHPEHLEHAESLLEDAAEVIDDVAAGRVPTGRGGYEHPAGFAADGLRGMVTVRPSENARVRIGGPVGWTITPYLYGTFSEPVIFDEPIYDRLYAQALRNPSFEWGHPPVEETVERFLGHGELEPAAVEAVLNGEWFPRRKADHDQLAAPWLGVGDAGFALVSDAVNTKTAQRILANSAGAGVAQIVDLPAWRTSTYHLEGYARGSVAEARILLYHAGQVVETKKVAVDNGWRNFEVDLHTPSPDGPANTFVLAIVADQPGELDLDLVTLYPDDALDGFDPQAVAQLENLNTGWIRWPGGNFASAYHWRDGVGPLEERRARPNPAWRGLVSSRVGTDEFLQLSERVGFEPLICVNAGNGTPEEAAAWVEYANGDSATAMGSLRAANGRAEPYDVRYWNIGNELWGFWQVGYCDPEENARRYLRFAEAMRAVDPSITLIAVGVGAHSIGDPVSWNEPLIEIVGDKLEIIDIHSYVNVPRQADVDDATRATLLSAIALSYEQWMMSFRKRLVDAGLEHVKIDVGEYNGNANGEDEALDDSADLLYYASYLHAFIRQSEYIIGANATEYSVFDPRATPFGRIHPRFNLHSIYSVEVGQKPLELQLETPVMHQPERMGRDVVPIFNMPLIDAVALQDTTDGSIALSLINRDPSRAISVETGLEGGGTRYIFDGKAVEKRPINDASHVTLDPLTVTLIKMRP